MSYPVDKVTKLPDPIDIDCSWDDDYFSITDGAGVEKVYNNDEAQYLLEQLILWGQPWNSAG